MSETNGIHTTVPPRYSIHSNGFVQLTDLSQFPEGTYDDTNSDNYSENGIEPLTHSAIEEEEYHCRTCLNVTDKDSSVWIMETIILDKTIRDVIVYLVPEMESQLINDEMVCANCLETLQSTMKFIVKCLEVNAVLAEEIEQMYEVPPISDSLLEKCRDDDIKAEEIDAEHDYCGKIVSVGDIVSTDDLDEVKENVTILKLNEGNTMLVRENKAEVQYETAAEWGANGEEALSERIFTLQECETFAEEANVEEMKILRCSTCGENFESKEAYQAHLQIHVPFVCETCGKTFRKRDSLRMHRLSHNDPNSYICEVCGKGCRDHNSLRSHMKVHASDDSFICDKCSKAFKNRRLLDIHVKYVHDKAYSSQCTICGILSKNETSLKTHMKLVHFKEKPFECDICQKRFGRSDYLHNHKLRHTAEPRIVKRQSEKRKVKTRTRMRYKIQDPGEPVPCKFCGQWYKDIVRLKRHLETHLKRYPCQFCPLTFPRNILCKRHEEMHQGGAVNFFRCNVCWKKFNTKETLNEHLKCHNNPQHFCDLCGKTFNRKFLLSHHKLVEHSNIPDKEQPEEIIYDSLLEVGGLSTGLDSLSKD